jgi:hypothetical protein
VIYIMAARLLVAPLHGPTITLSGPTWALKGQLKRSVTVGDPVRGSCRSGGQQTAGWAGRLKTRPGDDLRDRLAEKGAGLRGVDSVASCFFALGPGRRGEDRTAPAGRCGARGRRGPGGVVLVDRPCGQPACGHGFVTACQPWRPRAGRRPGAGRGTDGTGRGGTAVSRGGRPDAGCRPLGRARCNRPPSLDRPRPRGTVTGGDHVVRDHIRPEDEGRGEMK